MFAPTNAVIIESKKDKAGSFICITGITSITSISETNMLCCPGNNDIALSQAQLMMRVMVARQNSADRGLPLYTLAAYLCLAIQHGRAGVKPFNGSMQNKQRNSGTLDIA